MDGDAMENEKITINLGHVDLGHIDLLIAENSNVDRGLAVYMAQLVMPFLMLISLSSIAMGVLNADEHFRESSFAPVAFNLASIAGLRTAPGIAYYGVTKAGLIHLTEELAVELGPTVRVNAVAPAVVKTDFAKALYEGREDEVAKPYPLKRLGRPEDIAGPVAFLASEDAAWVTGQTLPIDGGITLTGGF